MNNLQNPVPHFVPVIDALHIQVKRKFIDILPVDAFFFPNHTTTNLFTVNRRTAKETYDSDSYQLVLAAKCRNTQFHLQYDILHRNQQLGSIFLDSVKVFETQADLVPVHLSNQILYFDWIPLLTGFLAAFDLHLHRYTQVDVALDTHTPLQDKFLHYYGKESVYHFIQGKRPSTDIGTAGKRYRNGHRNESFYIGSAKSDKQTVLYNKTLDIAEKGKEYITRWHEANGLDTTKPVHRAEVHIYGDALTTTAPAYATADGEILTAHKYQACLKTNNNHRPKATKINKVTKYPIDYQRFNDPIYLTLLFADHHGLNFRKKDATRITNCTEIQFFDFTIYDKSLTTMKPTPYYTETKNNDYRNEKKMLKECVIRFKETGKLHHLEYAAEVATENNLTGILNQLLLEFNTDHTIKHNGLQRCIEELVLENHLHLRY